MKHALAFVLLTVIAASASAQEGTPVTAPEAEVGVSTRKTRITGYPYVYYTPETEFAFGLGGIVTFYPSSQDTVAYPSKASVSAYYSTRKQYKVSLNPEIYLSENRWKVSTPLSFGSFVDKFWGTGSGSPDIDSVDYRSEVFDAVFTIQFPPLLQNFTTRAGFTYELNNTTIIDQKGNPNLEGVAGKEGGLTSGMGLNWVVDTRDHVFFPNKGVLVQFSMVYFIPGFGSDYTYGRWILDARHYKAFSPDQVLAFQAYGEFVNDTPPFYKLPAMGGQNRMRGYYYGRYRDKDYVTGQIEYRQYFWKKLGFVAFVGVGDVASSFASLKIREFNTSWGGGLRFKFNEAEKVNLRVDLGLGKDTSGVYFGLEEAF